MRKRKKVKEKRLAIKMFICAIYLIIITILFACSYTLFEQKSIIVPWSEVQSVDDYTYIDISKMSEKFAYYEESNIGIHFVIEKETSGLWHTYIIAINENDYNKYKEIIDYTYERVKEAPEPIRVYGYPTITDDNIKKMVIKNIPNFVPAENEVTITEENYNSYLTNSYLDTTRERNNDFSIILCISLLLLFVVIALLIMTILDRDKIVDSLDEKLEEELNKSKQFFKKARK